MLIFEGSSRFPDGAGWAAPLVFQQKPGTQIFFFRKTSPSARKFLKQPACFSTKA
jgi:hypothetical protein